MVRDSHAASVRTVVRRFGDAIPATTADANDYRGFARISDPSSGLPGVVAGQKFGNLVVSHLRQRGEPGSRLLVPAAIEDEARAQARRAPLAQLDRASVYGTEG